MRPEMMKMHGLDDRPEESSSGHGKEEGMINLDQEVQEEVEQEQVQEGSKGFLMYSIGGMIQNEMKGFNFGEEKRKLKVTPPNMFSKRTMSMPSPVSVGGPAESMDEMIQINGRGYYENDDAEYERDDSGSASHFDDDEEEEYYGRTNQEFMDYVNTEDTVAFPQRSNSINNMMMMSPRSPDANGSSNSNSSSAIGIPSPSTNYRLTRQDSFSSTSSSSLPRYSPRQMMHHHHQQQQQQQQHYFGEDFQAPSSNQRKFTGTMTHKSRARHQRQRYKTEPVLPYVPSPPAKSPPPSIQVPTIDNKPQLLRSNGHIARSNSSSSSSGSSNNNNNNNSGVTTPTIAPMSRFTRPRRTVSSTELPNVEAFNLSVDSENASVMGNLGSLSRSHRSPRMTKPMRSYSSSRELSSLDSFDMESIKIGNEIGFGSFGAVYSAISMIDGKQYAVKRLRENFGGAAGVEDPRSKAHQEEIRVMQDLHHENIVQYYGSRPYVDGETAYLEIFMELVPGGSIGSLVKTYGALSEQLVSKFGRHILQGVHYLHSKNVIHRDIKGANVLIDINGTAKLADFGCSRLISDMNSQDMQTLCRIRGSVPWMAPEMIREIRYDLPADIWSVAATILEMASGQRPWPEIKEQMPAIFTIGNTKGPPPMPDNIPDYVKETLRKCFQIEPSDRPTAAELLQEPWLEE